MPPKVDWRKAIQPLLKKYKKERHPLEYGNIYQLVVMVVLSAQDSDKNINKLAPALFKAFPNMNALSKASEETLFPLISKVRNFGNKANWLMSMAKEIIVLSGITIERTLRLCGAIGVSMKLLASGKATGPPQLKE